MLFWVRMQLARALPDAIGAPMLGQLACSGVGLAMATEEAKDVQLLRASCATNNAALLAELREVCFVWCV